jgi:molecular chaperone DnaK
VLAGERSDLLLMDVTPLSLGIETLGGVMAKMIQKNTTIPTKFSQVYTTADDKQPAVTVKVYQGEREIVAGNKLLGEFSLVGIAPAPRGVPQIDVSFDIDANGILHVHAKDKATGKENRITIKANSGLTEAEIQKMVKDAELNAEEDRRVKLLAESRNQGDALVHATRKSLAEYGDKLDGGERDKVETAIVALEAAVKGGDKAELDARLAALSAAAQKLGEKVYAGGQGAAGGGEPPQAPGQAASPGQPDEGVVDAEFKEVKGK